MQAPGFTITGQQCLVLGGQARAPLGGLDMRVQAGARTGMKVPGFTITGEVCLVRIPGCSEGRSGHLSVGSTCVYRLLPARKVTIATAIAAAGIAKPIAQLMLSCRAFAIASRQNKAE